MRRAPHRLIAVLALALATGVLPLGAAAPDRAPHRCTAVGTPRPDILAGGTGADVLCARGAGDYLSGGNGADVLKGGRGDDTAVGGKGADVLRGRRGPDRLFAVGDGGNDLLVGGRGFDRCFGDPGDQFRRCEQRFTGPGATASRELSSSFAGLSIVGQEAQTELAEVCAGTPAPPPICREEG